MFDIVGRIKLLDAGASTTLDRVTKQTDRAGKAVAEYAGTMSTLKRATETVSRSSVQLNRAFSGLETGALSAARASSKTSSVLRESAADADRLTSRGNNAAGSLKTLTGVGLGLFAAFQTASGATTMIVNGINTITRAATNAGRALTEITGYTLKLGAEYEMNKVSLEAMFGTGYEKNVKEYLDYVQERANISPLELDDFISSGRSFVPLTKDVEQLEKMTNLMERLSALDPIQGSSGAALALREMFSGDSLSLVERFEMPRKILNDIKDLPLEKQLVALDKLFAKMGASNELLERQSETALGKYNKAIGTLTTSIRDMGFKGLDQVKPILDDFHEWLNSAQFGRITDFGSNLFSSMLSGAASAVREVGEYIDQNFMSNAKFQALDTFGEKVTAILDTVGADLANWWDTGGAEQFESAAKRAVDAIAGVIRTSSPTIGAVAYDVAFVVGGEFLKGFKDGILGLENEIMRKMQSSMSLYNQAQNHNANNPDTPMIEGGEIKPAPDRPWYEDAWGAVSSAGSNVQRFVRGYSSGLDNVPYQGFPAILHKGEAVLTRGEADEYRRERDGRGPSGQVVITGNTFNVRKEADIQKIARQLAYEMAF